MVVRAVMVATTVVVMVVIMAMVATVGVTTVVTMDEVDIGALIHQKKKRIRKL